MVKQDLMESFINITITRMLKYAFTDFSNIKTKYI